MPKRVLLVLVAVIVTAMLVLLPVQSAFAHEHREVGAYEVTVGWLEEPAFAGFRNAVQFVVERPAPGGHSDEGEEEEPGTPVTNVTLKVEVIFGDKDATEKTEVMDLTPAFGIPGQYRAFLVPSRPGTYTFHVTGTIGSTKVDEYFTSGEDTFNDMRNPAESEFPLKDPTRGELADRVTKQGERIEVVQTAASDADGSASLAMWLAIGGLVLGAGALGVSLKRRSG